MEFGVSSHTMFDKLFIVWWIGKNTYTAKINCQLILPSIQNSGFSMEIEAAGKSTYTHTQIVLCRYSASIRGITNSFAIRSRLVFTLPNRGAAPPFAPPTLAFNKQITKRLCSMGHKHCCCLSISKSGMV